MQLGMVGLGRMGANMVRRLAKNGHECVVFDRSPQAVADLAKEDKVAGASSLQDFARMTATSTPRGAPRCEKRYTICAGRLRLRGLVPVTRPFFPACGLRWNQSSLTQR